MMKTTIFLAVPQLKNTNSKKTFSLRKNLGTTSSCRDLKVSLHERSLSHSEQLKTSRKRLGTARTSLTEFNQDFADYGLVKKIPPVKNQQAIKGLSQ